MSNVPKSEQNPTSIDYLTLGMDTRKRIVNYIFKDLGPDQEILPDGSINPNYRIIVRINQTIYKFLSDMEANLTQADNIRITSRSEYHKRRAYLTDAIGNCKQVMHEIQFGVDVAGLKASKYDKVIDDLTLLIKTIGNRRKADNKYLSK